MAAAVKMSLDSLRKDMNAKKTDLGKCSSKLVDLKIALTSLPGLAPGAALSPEALKDVSVARDVYETAALLSIQKEHKEAFEKHVAQARTYYLDYASVLSPSADQNLLLSLSLMQKLAENRIAEFHTDLELVPPPARADPALAYVLRLEQYLMEGSYAKITASANDTPHPSFAFFIALLMVTVRDEIAACSESAYKHVSVSVAKKMLSLDSEDELRAFAEIRQWKIAGDTIHFVDAAEQAPSMDQVPSEEIIKRALAYAQRLEQIV